MQAIILAAGMGKRLKELTQDNTKCMVQVNGMTLVERTLTQIDQLNINKIIIVVGYEGQKLIDYIATLDIATPIEYVNNEIYYKTNNIYSLYMAADHLIADDTLLFESDIIFEQRMIQDLVEDPRETLALVDKYESWMDGTVVKVDDEDSIVDFIPGKKFDFKDIDSYYKTVNIYKFSKEFSATHYVPFLEAYLKALGNNEYYEQVLKVIATLDNPEIKVKRLDGHLWYEIDDLQDLDIAESLFAAGDEDKLDQLSSRYGGYWRYPKMLDYCYLVNPYFPPARLVEEMKANFDILLRQYPSGMRVNALLAAKNFEVSQKHILVGNGAAELIKSLMDQQTGTLGCVRPTFEEYPNRYNDAACISFHPTKEDFRYDDQDLIEFYQDKHLSMLLLVNPDNPTGNFITREGAIRLLEWSKSQNIRLVIDESFVDFAGEDTFTLLDDEIMETYPNLVVMKSISKSYGVPGIRLGVMASGDQELIAKCKKDVAIWNINSYGEFFMQIFEKYRKDYQGALVRFVEVRDAYVEELKQISNLHVMPSKANYVMCQIDGGISAREVTVRLLRDHNILIKDLSSKMKDGAQYIRLAVRTQSENQQLVKALKDILE